MADSLTLEGLLSGATSPEPVGADALPGTPPEPAPRNPYIDFLLKEPSLSQSAGVERGPLDRFRQNFEDARRNTVLGAGEAAIFNRTFEEADVRNPGDVADVLRGERIKRRAAEYEAMRPADTPLEYLVAGAGQVAGSLVSPETVIGVPTRLVTAGRTVTSRILRAGASGAAINTAFDPAVQALRIEAGLQDTYSPSRTAIATGMGFALPVGVQGVLEGGRALSRLSRAEVPAEPAGAPGEAPEAPSAPQNVPSAVEEPEALAGRRPDEGDPALQGIPEQTNRQPAEAPDAASAVTNEEAAPSSSAEPPAVIVTTPDEAPAGSLPAPDVKPFTVAVAAVRASGKASTAMIQRTLGVGYNDAATLIARMERDGVISAASETGRREVLPPRSQDAFDAAPELASEVAPEIAPALPDEMRSPEPTAGSSVNVLRAGSVEQTPAGAQGVIPGAERISQAEEAQRAVDARLRPTAIQRPMDDGLFGDGAAQSELLMAATRTGPVRQGYNSLPDLYAAAPARQIELEEAGRTLADEIGVDFRTPGIKLRETAEAKMARKGYRSASQITDVVRAGFAAATTADADAIVAGLAARFDVLDEGWNISPAGYVDRKVLVRFPDGLTGEVQIWEPNMLAAKQSGGHKLYVEARSLAPDDPRKADLIAQQQEAYSAAAAKAGPRWAEIVAGSAGNSPNRSAKMVENAASETTYPLSATSAASTSDQASPGASTANARDPLITAGRYSQFTNRMGETSSTSIGSEATRNKVQNFESDTVASTPGKRAGVFLFDPRELQVDADTFQFKAGGDAEGVTPILRGVTRWDPDAAGQLVVWQREDGALFVADGHQRTSLARRLLKTGAESDIRIPGSLYRESDGWAADDVMISAALKNIREGSGDAMDAARVLRVTPKAVDDISEIGRAQTRQAVALARLSDEVWRMAVNEVIEPRDAAVIGRLVQGNDELQLAVAKLMARVKPASEAEAEILARRARESELVSREDAAQGGFFGDLDGPESIVAEETRIVSQAVRTLAKDRNMLRRVGVNAERIEQTGSRIERDATAAAVDEAGQIGATIEGLAFRRGPVRDRLIELAKELKRGSLSTADATQSFIDAVRGQTRPGDGGGRASGRRGNGNEAARSAIHAYAGHLRGKPLAGEPGRSAAGVAGGPGIPQAERLKDISDRLIDSLGLTVRQGRISRRGALGTYNESSGVTRLREPDTFDVLTHEGGHGLHLRPANKAPIDALIAAHASEVERLAYAGATPGSERTEGFAEWFRLFLTNPAYADREAPTFTPAFKAWMEANRKETFDDLTAAQNAYRDWLQAPSRDVLTGDLVTSAAPPLATRIGRAVSPDRLPGGQSLFGLLDRFYTWSIDSLHPVNRAVRALSEIHFQNTGQRLEIKAADNAYKLMRLATNANQAGHGDLIRGVSPYRGMDPEGPSLAEAVELAVGKNWFANWRSDELTDFGGYLVARRSIQEYGRFLAGEVPNPPGKLTLGDYQQAVRDYEAAHPNYARAAPLVYEWQTNLLKKKFDAGLVSKTYYDTALSRSDYVPFQRDFAEQVEEGFRVAGSTRGTNRQSVMKAYRGSLRSIINPLESMMADAYDTAAIIARNDAVKAMARLALQAGPDGGAIAEIIPAKQLKPIRVDVVEALRAAGKDAGIDKADLDELILTATETLDADDIKATLFRAGDAPEKGEPIIYYWEGGERKALRLGDRGFGREMYQAITQIGAEQSNWIIDMLSVPARALRIGITSHPSFLLANYLRDQVMAFVLNGKFVPFYSGAKGVVAELAQGRAARLYARAGGMMGGAEVASLNEARIGRDMRALQRRGYSIQRLKDPREILKLTEVSETGSRLALFQQYYDTARKNGLSEYEAMIEGAYQARDYMDFGRHGSKMLAARRLVTFFNAALQGTDKTGRVLVGQLRPLAKVFRGEALLASEKAALGQSAQAWAKISAITALSATYSVMNRDEPEFQQASEYLRATHWLFKMPGGTWVALPKPYEMATIFNLGERAAEAISGEDPTWADKWMRSWAYTLAIPTEPAGLMTPAEIMFNFDAFRDRPIVEQWDLGKEPALQFNEYTSEFSKAVGAAINVSPAKIDHLILGWSGSWGRDILAATSAIVDPQRRSAELYDWPVTGRFVKNLARGSDATTKFYGLVSETGGRLERKNNSYKDFLGRGQDAAAVDYYAGLSDDEKVWVSLNQLEGADNKRLHPLRRAADITKVYGGIKRDIANCNIVTIIGGDRVEVNPTIASAIQDQLGRAAAIETRNAMIVVGEPGWAGRQTIDPASHLDAVKQLSPEIGQEIADRLRKVKVLPFEGVRSVWPELRDRLLREGSEAFVADLRGHALSAQKSIPKGKATMAPPSGGPGKHKVETK